MTLPIVDCVLENVQCKIWQCSQYDNRVRCCLTWFSKYLPWAYSIYTSFRWKYVVS